MPFNELCILCIFIVKVGKTVKVLSANEYFVPQTRALIRMVKEAWGEIDKWDDVKLKDLGQILKGLDKKEISMLIDDTVKVTFITCYITWISSEHFCILFSNIKYLVLKAISIGQKYTVDGTKQHKQLLVVQKVNCMQKCLTYLLH